MISQSSIPEVKEEVIGYALNERKLKLSQFQDLGPPDLITLVKYLESSSTAASTSATSNKTNAADSQSISTTDPATALNDLHSHDKLKGEMGTFFYSLGADTSDPTSVSIFLKKIADAITEQPQAWFGKRKNFQIARISLSTWNTFRKCDMNVVVHIPGTVQVFILDSNGENLPIDPNSDENGTIWAEAFVSGVVRSLMLMKDNYEDGELQNLVETLIVSPLTSGEIESVAETFIDSFPLVYEVGDLLGAPYHSINISRTNNYLVETLLEIVKLTHHVQKCRTMLESLMVKHPEVVIILSRLLLENDLEVDAVELMHQHMEIIEKSSNKSTNFSAVPYQFPLDYKSELLCIQARFLLDNMKDYELARALAQEAVHCTPSEFTPWYLLTKAYIKLKDIENSLLTLNACPMSTLKEKYVLKRVVSFPSESSLHLPLPVDVVLDEVTSLNPQEIQKEHKSADPALVNLAAANLKSTYQLCYKLLTEIVQITGWESLLKYRSKIFVMEDEYQSSSEEINNGSTTNTASSVNAMTVAANSTTVNTSTNTVNDTLSSSSLLRAKRLCERWLDNLFMLLYEDLKTYTLWQTEQLYFEAQNTNYNKLTFEWELFGLCARRLGHYPEAARAFQRGLSQRFSSQSARKLLEYCINERQRIRQLAGLPTSDMTSSQIITRVNELDISIIDLCVKICCWNHRWYIEYSTQLIEAMSVVVQDLGLTKVSNEISARYPETVFTLVTENMLNFFEKYTNDYFDS
ncbi:hypothetical protein KAFR_0D01480 [Kazachstania africana CBS 2517]|uniref:Bud site selection protein 7 n=1 Tax=Kazachstania africana (strain ATCC 22294 / BCRC 22015 / CBS 2517 / CECT 1963 / NBRC 1671 / NRRL Y-8276) TaxID=1071382 RepID=H2ATU4_KAZAF|nr:hypothetical protein KAFR_0D01480 [Kazachstania africana CBS 2517]CCF57794.1 hypothetical protein KAFR_0D01480 [Kazachstania africana CBS 2517]